MGSLYVEECGGKCDQIAQWDPIHMAANPNFTKFKQEIELREGVIKYAFIEELDFSNTK